MASISSKEANDIVTSLGLLSFAIKNNGKVSKAKPTDKTSFAYSLFSLDRTMKDMVTTLNSIFLMLKKSMDVKAENERRTKYFEKENALESAGSLDANNKPRLSASKAFSVAEMITSPFLKAAIAVSLLSLLPKEVKDKIASVLKGIALQLGFTEKEFDSFKKNLKTAGIVIASLGAINIASTLIPAIAALAQGFMVFCTRFGIKPPIALATIAAGAAFGVSYLKKKWEEDVGNFEKEIEKKTGIAPGGTQGPGISGTMQPGGNGISLSTPTEQLKEIISRGESKGDYNVVFGAGVYPTPEQTVGKSLTDMTVDEVINYQQKYLLPATKGNIGKGDLGTTAVGKYQIITPTLEGLINKGVVRRDEKFTPVVQERLGTALIDEQRQSARSDEDFSRRINAVWEGARTNAQEIENVSGQMASALNDLNSMIDQSSGSTNLEAPPNNTGKNVAEQSQANRAASMAGRRSSVDVRRLDNTTQSTDNKALQKQVDMKSRDQMDNPNAPALNTSRS